MQPERDPLFHQDDRAAQLDSMIEWRLKNPWIDRALKSDHVERWRLAFAELLDQASEEESP